MTKGAAGLVIVRWLDSAAP